jgi:hypothetical protein
MALVQKKGEDSSMIRVRMGLLVATAFFAFYGVKELVEAVRYGGPLADGLEALGIGAVTLAGYAIVTKVVGRDDAP